MVLPLFLLIFVGLLSMTEMMNYMGGQISEAAEFFSAILIYLLLVAALLIPLIMGVWFASCLIVFDKMTAWHAFKLSFKACAINIWPFTIYGLVGLLFSLIAMIPAGLGFLILGPIILCSMYTGYKSIFMPEPHTESGQ